MRHVVLVLASLSVALAGCADSGFSQSLSATASWGGNSVSFGGQGQYTGEIEEKRLECDTDGTLSVAGQGQGSLEVIIYDAADEEIGHFTLSGQSQEGSQSSLDGQNGTWTVRVTTGYHEHPIPGIDPIPKGFQGQYGGTVTC